MGILGGGLFCDWCPAGLLPDYRRRSRLGPPLSGPFFGFFGVFAFGYSGLLLLLLPCWHPWPSCSGLAWAFVFWLLFFGACLGFWPFCFGLRGRAWPSDGRFFWLLPSGLGTCLGSLPSCLGLCGLAWPSGGLFVCAATLGGWLLFRFGRTAGWDLVGGGASGNTQGCPFI